MQVITKNQIAAIHAELAKLGRARGEKVGAGEKAELVLQYTGGRTDTTTGMTRAEAQRLIGALKGTAPQGAAERMRRNIIAMAHEMKWEHADGRVDMERVNGWCERFGQFHRGLNEHSEAELAKLVSQFKSVYNSYLKSI